MPSPETEVKLPATETSRPAEIPVSELSSETKTQMTPEAQSRFAKLPERQKGMFERARERFSKEKEPTEQVRGAQEYFEAQRAVVRAAELKLSESQKEHSSALAEAEAKGKRAVDVSAMPDSVEALLDDPALEGLGMEKKEEALKGAKERAGQEFKILKKQQAQAAERATKLEDQVAVTQGKIEKFKDDSEKARDRLDDAVIRAINSTSEQGVALEENVAKVDKGLLVNRERVAQLDVAIASLDAKIKDAKEPLVVEILRPLVTQAKAERTKLKEQERKLAAEKDRHGKQLDKMVKKNEKMVPYLGLKKLEALLDDSEHGWVIPMLSGDQIANLSEDRQREILSGNSENQKALLPKLKEAQLKKLSDTGIVPTKEALLAQGILKQPAEVSPIEEARAKRDATAAAEAAPAKESEDAKPKTRTIAEWKNKIAETMTRVGTDARGVGFPDGVDTIDLSEDEVVDVGYDQAVASVKAEAGGDKQKEESLLKKVLKEFAKMVKELFGFTLDEAEGLITAGVTGRTRKPFNKTIDAWNNANKANPGAKINMDKVPRELHGQDLSEASAKLKLMELVKKQDGGDTEKVKAFFERQASESHAAAA
ncbi:MAG: hypothetical protein Q7S48_04480 [bacterium]|nr:hypothetical protein [bacterium]